MLKFDKESYSPDDAEVAFKMLLLESAIDRLSTKVNHLLEETKKTNKNDRDKGLFEHVNGKAIYGT